MKTARTSRVAIFVVVFSILTASFAFADTIANDITVDGNNNKIMNLTYGGSSGSTVLSVSPTGDDGRSGCNFGGSGDRTLVANVASSDATVASTPATVTFTKAPEGSSGCGTTPTLTVSPLKAGSTTITLAEGSTNTTGGTFTFAGATFTVVVAKAAGSVSINNIPADAVFGGDFTPEYTKAGDGVASTTSNSTSTCTVDSSGKVSFVAAGTCKLQAAVAEGTNHLAATGDEQTFTITGASYTGRFLAPVDGGGVINIVKQGRVIPVKLEISDGTNEVKSGNVTFTQRKGTCSSSATADPVTETVGSSNSGNAFRFVTEGSDDFWQFNLNTRSLTLGCSNFDVWHGTSHVATFILNVGK